jgi:hypothetical protein
VAPRLAGPPPFLRLGRSQLIANTTHWKLANTCGLATCDWQLVAILHCPRFLLAFPQPHI